MRPRIIEVLFGIALIGAAVSGLLAIPSDTDTSAIARLVFPLLAALVVALKVLQRRAKAKFGLGYLKPGAARMNERERNRVFHVVIEAQLRGRRKLNSRVTGNPMEHEDVIVSTEMLRLLEEWKAANPDGKNTDAEYKSLFLLQAYAFSTEPDEKRDAFLDEINDPAAFRAFRQRVQAAIAARAKRAVPKEKVTDMSHLLKGGWTAFLQGMPHPDPVLWHGLATDFHGIEKNGRLDAAFWLLGQPECDRATASDFIRGFVAYELFETAARSSDTTRLNAFKTLVQRYNAGFYKWFGIVPDVGGIEPIAETVEGDFDDVAVAAMMRRIAAETGIGPVTVPVGLLSFKDRPTNPMPGLIRSAYEFWDDAGLHIRETV